MSGRFVQAIFAVVGFALIIGGAAVTAGGASGAATVQVATPISWGAPTQVDTERGSPTAISCPTRAFCMIVDRSGRAVPVVRGVPQQPQKVVDSPAQLWSVSCTGSDFCLAGVYDGRVARYDGAGWTVETTTLPPTAMWGTEVSCASPSFCLAARAGWITRYLGNRWTAPEHVPRLDFEFRTLSCPSRAFCMGVAVKEAGSVSRAYRWADGTWTSQHLLSNSNTTLLSSVSCPSSRFCMAVGGGGGGAAFRYRHSGGWQRISAAGLGYGDSAVSCASTTFCMALTNGEPEPTITASRYNGRRFLQPHTIFTTGNLMWRPTVSCPAVDSCTALDLFGDGRRWSGEWDRMPRVLDRTQGELLAVSCGSPQLCVAVDSYGNYVAFHGAGWTPVRRIARVAQGTSVIECQGTTFCLTVDSLGRAWRYDGMRWSRAGATGLHGSIGEKWILSCGSLRFCMAGNQEKQIAAFNGRTWSPVAGIPGRYGELWNISCASDGFCAAVKLNWPGQRVFTYGNGAWHLRAVLPRRLRAVEISCVRALCMLNDRDGRVVVLDRTGALSTIVRPATSVAGGASCVSATLCVLDGITVAYVWNGVNFSEPQQLTDDPFASGIGLSCVRPLFCAAIGSSGAVVGA